jgi:diaminopimelate epimerase
MRPATDPARPALHLAKAHAYGNDFLYVPADDARGCDEAALARVLCERHTGAGADGLILFSPTPDGARMRLFNADGSPSEVSGNGVRGLAALVVRSRRRAGLPVPAPVVIDTDAGAKQLHLVAEDGTRLTFRAAMGQPEAIERRTIEAGGETLAVVVLRVGNPQCVVLEPRLDEARYRRLGPLLERHETFPAGTNVEFACVERPDRVRILIWERGVGPTLASGTGACAAAVAAAACGGGARSADVMSPGGVQRVDWLDSGLVLTGWAEVVWEGQWLR